MEENKKEVQDYASELINHLLIVMKEAQEKLPEGFQIDGVSCQRYSKNSINVVFTFKS